MDTRTAPRWIRDRKKGYERSCASWEGNTLLGMLGLPGCWLYSVIHGTATAQSSGAALFLCVAGLIGLGLLRPFRRARRYEMAARILEAAIARYEVSPERPDATLTEADERACEVLRVARIRTAPAWVMEKRRRYEVKILARFGPAVLALALLAACVLLRWRWVGQGRGVFVILLPVALAIQAGFMARRLGAARAILGVAIDRYEYEATATEGTLEEADQRASEALDGR